MPGPLFHHIARFVVSLALLAMAPAVAAAGQPAADAAEAPAVSAVRAFLLERAGGLGDSVAVEVRSPSAHLPPCVAPEVFMPGRGQKPWGRVSVGVRCGEQQRRVRYMQARVTVTGRYWVSAGELPAGTPIRAGMLSAEQGDLSRLPANAVLERDRIVGQEAARPLPAGTVIQSHQLRKPALVERRQAVTLVAGGEGFRISREGHALDDGALGGRVRVRLSNREVVTAQVTGPGRARVMF
ncbi:MAG: flagellar basal body P-ring formation chaperone FlgA [Alloalcanivorax venustensis]|jgi:flagellar basal body P-ring formation protein FlgA|uniref:flagellar basal body P-ring formation chaperone FlgA n=1 Tax=Alloalcanivorax venustensis TaxID=172371 RepID=UPI0030039430|tara:strand:- start:2281 stop:3000 length:720 start_codon:yes stop_codon:yes gene_type:complete